MNLGIIWRYHDDDTLSVKWADETVSRVDWDELEGG